MKDDIFTIHSATTEQGLGANIQLRALKGLEHTWLQRPFSKLKKYSFCLFQQLDRQSQLQEKDWPTCVCNYSTRLQVQQGLSGNSFIFLLFPVGGRPAVQRAPTGFSLEPIYHWKIKKRFLLSDADRKCQRKALPFSTDWELLAKHNNHMLSGREHKLKWQVHQQQWDIPDTATA